MTRITFSVLLALLASWPAFARAQQVIPVAFPPVIRMQMRSGTLTIRTWQRSAVSIDSTAPVRARHFGPGAVAAALPLEVTIPSSSVTTRDGTALLPAESFPLGPLVAEPHDGVVIFGGNAAANVTLTIPESTALVWALVGNGGITMQGLRGGTAVLLVRNGFIRMNDVAGDAYAEAARGPIFVENSAFNRIRARTAAGNVVFRNCNVRQIEAGSVAGSVAYDNGTFVPGIARFESQFGDVAIGIAGGGATIDAHSAGGRIFAGLGGNAAVSGSQTDAQAIVGGGGPVVTANSERGAVFLYDGSLRSRGRLKGAWQPIARLLQRPFEKRPRLQQKLPHRGHV